MMGHLFESFLVSNLVSLLNVTLKDVVHQIRHIGLGIGNGQQLRKTALLHIFVKSPASKPFGQRGLLLRINARHRTIFLE